jgi:hypothetical protein
MRENTERWMELAKLAATEQDPIKMLELVREINELLEKKQKRLDGEGSEKQMSPYPPVTSFPTSAVRCWWSARTSLRFHACDQRRIF